MREQNCQHCMCTCVLARTYSRSMSPSCAPDLVYGLQIAEKGGLVPDSETLTRFLSPTIPGFHFESPDFLEPRLDLLKNAASRSLDHVSSLLSLQHGVDCELQELSAIAFFMHQISLQVHIMYRNLPAARWALSLLTARPHDDASHVHTWYWAAGVHTNSQCLLCLISVCINQYVTIY